MEKTNEIQVRKKALYKTELCRSREENGQCPYGSKCQFAHSEKELRNLDRHPRYKTEMCKTFWEKGSCPYGKRCCFIHTQRQRTQSEPIKIITTPVLKLEKSKRMFTAEHSFNDAPQSAGPRLSTAPFALKNPQPDSCPNQSSFNSKPIATAIEPKRSARPRLSTAFATSLSDAPRSANTLVSGSPFGLNQISEYEPPRSAMPRLSSSFNSNHSSIEFDAPKSAGLYSSSPFGVNPLYREFEAPKSAIPLATGSPFSFSFGINPASSDIDHTRSAISGSSFGLPALNTESLLSASFGVAPLSAGPRSAIPSSPFSGNPLDSEEFDPTIPASPFGVNPHDTEFDPTFPPSSFGLDTDFNATLLKKSLLSTSNPLTPLDSPRSNKKSTFTGNPLLTKFESLEINSILSFNPASEPQPFTALPQSNKLGSHPSGPLSANPILLSNHSVTSAREVSPESPAKFQPSPFSSPQGLFSFGEFGDFGRKAVRVPGTPPSSPRWS